MKNVYVLQKNTRYMDGYRVQVNNRTCRVCTHPFRRDLVGNQHVPDNHLCSECRFWAVVRVDGVHYRITYEPALIATIAFHDGRNIHTDNLWHQGTIPAVWVGLGLTDNAEFRG